MVSFAGLQIINPFGREHWEVFPREKPINIELLTEVTGTLVYAGYGALSASRLDESLLRYFQNLDALTSPLSTTPYDDGEIEKMLAYIRNLKRGRFTLLIDAFFTIPCRCGLYGRLRTLRSRCVRCF